MKLKDISIIVCMILFLYLTMAIVLRPAEAEAASISLKAALDPSQNQYLASQGYYDVTRFYFSTDDKLLCNSTNCMYEVEMANSTRTLSHMASL
jgi:hypothetical protein